MKCIKCGADVENNATRCNSCSLEFTDEIKEQMIAYDKQMEEYNRQMEEYNRKMEEYNNRTVVQSDEKKPESVLVQSEENLEDVPAQPIEMSEEAAQNGQNKPVPQMPDMAVSQAARMKQAMPQMGMQGYIYGAGQPQKKDEKKKGVPNIIAMLGAVIVLASVFLPYVKQGNTTRSLWDAFGSTSLLLVLLIGAMFVTVVVFILSFFNNTSCKIINLIFSLIIAGLLIFEFVLTVIDKRDYADAAFGVGSIISIIGAGLLIVAVPIWSAIFKQKKA